MRQAWITNANAAQRRAGARWMVTIFVIDPVGGRTIAARTTTRDKREARHYAAFQSATPWNF